MLREEMVDFVMFRRGDRGQEAELHPSGSHYLFGFSI
jgi:hypothetical protein